MMSRLGGKVVSLPSKRSNSCVVDDWELENTPNKRQANESSSSQSTSSESSSSSGSSSSSSGDSKSSDIHNPAVSSPQSFDAYASFQDSESIGIPQIKSKSKFSKSKDTISATANNVNNGVTNVKRLLSTGLLEGDKVTYKKQEKKLPGIISGLGYLCGCSQCNFTKLVSAVQFEQHAGCKTKNQNGHIFLDNGKSLYRLVQDLQNTPSESMNDHIRVLVSGSLLEPATRPTPITHSPASSCLVSKQKNYFSQRPKKSLKMDSRVSKSDVGQKDITCRKKRDNGLHQLIFMPNGLPDGAELAYYASGKKLLDGYKQGDGIVCSCCDQKIRPSVFEAHAGCETKRQPYRHIFTSDGVSLHDLAISLKHSTNDGDQSSTPRVLELPTLVAGGTKLCRTHDYSAGKCDEQTFLRCGQCEKKYNVAGVSNVKEPPPKGKWYCCKDCRRIHSALEDLILNGPKTVPASITRSLNGKGIDDVRWQLLSGRTDAPEHDRSPLSKASAIFRNCFNPIRERSSGRDLIPDMLYARKIGEMEHGGMYCAVLSVNSVVVSAGILRILGKGAAEIPLVATGKASQGKGYCHALVSCIERFLCRLNVDNLVVPAAEQAISMWTNKFGFTKMTEHRLKTYTKDIPLTIFEGSTMLEKPLPGGV